MIIDLERFLGEEEPFWKELDGILKRMEEDTSHRMTLDATKRFHALYQRASADLAKIQTFSSAPEIRTVLESLVARAYAEIHETRERPHRLAPLQWFFQTFPRAFREHEKAFALSLAITLAGGALGALAIATSPETKRFLMPFPHLQEDPSKWVAYQEKQGAQGGSEGGKAMFSAFLMTHNTRISIAVMALGVSYGIGSILLLFQNGLLLGAVVADYLLAGEWAYLLGWLLPHGAIEIPALVIAGQAGLVLAGAMVGWGRRISLKARLRQAAPDLVTLVFGVGILLVWAGMVESFFSQYHEPVIPYALKIAFGLVEMILLSLFLSRSGRGKIEGNPRGTRELHHH